MQITIKVSIFIQANAHFENKNPILLLDFGKFSESVPPHSNQYTCIIVKSSSFASVVSKEARTPLPLDSKRLGIIHTCRLKMLEWI